MTEQYDFESEEDQIFPSMVQLTINNVCQLDCKSCPQQVYAKSDYNDKSRMSLDLFRKIVGEMSAHPQSTLRIFARGEPLLHPDLVEMVRIAKQEAKLSTVSLITNGILLERGIATKLIQHGLDLVEVSLDALHEDTYQDLRPLASVHRREEETPFDTIVQNVLQYVELRNKLNSGCKIVVSIIDQSKVAGEVDAFIEHWSQRVDRVLRRSVHSFQGRLEGIPVPEKRHPCRVLWNRFSIHSNGTVSLCYNDWKGEEILGDLNEEGVTVAKLWQHPAFEQYREGHRQGRFEGICKNCRDWTGGSWKTPYEKVFQEIVWSDATQEVQS